MPPKQSFWYRLGYALERTRQVPSASGRKLNGLRERRTTRSADRKRRASAPAMPEADELLASAITAAAARMIGALRPRRKHGLLGLVRAGLSGAGAAFLVELVRPLLEGRPSLPSLDGDLPERLLVGASQGLVYGTVVERFLPGPPLLKGALYGSAEYAVDPVGGLSRLLGSRTPVGRVPALAHVLEELDPHDRGYLEHLTFATALALLYGSSPSSSGILDDGGEDA